MTPRKLHYYTHTQPPLRANCRQVVLCQKSDAMQETLTGIDAESTKPARCYLSSTRAHQNNTATGIIAINTSRAIDPSHPRNSNRFVIVVSASGGACCSRANQYRVSCEEPVKSTEVGFQAQKSRKITSCSAMCAASYGQSRSRSITSLQRSPAYPIAPRVNGSTAGSIHPQASSSRSCAGSRSEAGIECCLRELTGTPTEKADNPWDHYLHGHAAVNVDQLGRRGNRLSCGRGLRCLSQDSRRRDRSERRSPFISIRRRCVGTLIRSGDCGPWVTWAWSAADTHTDLPSAQAPARSPVLCDPLTDHRSSWLLVSLKPQLRCGNGAEDSPITARLP